MSDSSEDNYGSDHTEDEPKAVEVAVPALASGRADTGSPLFHSDDTADFPVPFARWAVTLVHTHDEVFLTHLRICHGRENHTPAQWRGLLEGHRHTSAHPGP